MSSAYDKEQAEPTQKIQALEDFISEATKDSLNVESFLFYNLYWKRSIQLVV